MINLLIHLLFITTTIGMILMEFGSFGRTIDQYGYFNGATFSYLFFWMIFYLCYYGVQKYNFVLNKRVVNTISTPIIYSNKYIYKLLIIIFVFTTFFLFIQLFIFNGIAVLSGTMIKNEFRTTGVSNGLLAFGLLKFYAPALGALATYFFIKTENKKKMMYVLLFLIYFDLFILGLSWGYKSSGITILFPSLALLFYKISYMKFFILFIIAISLFAFLSIQFDTSVVQINSYWDALIFVLERITLYQSEVPWKIWDSYINSVSLPNYSSTLIGLFGNAIPKLFNIGTDYISSNYGLVVTYFVYPYENNILNGFNVTSTFYSESLIAFGYLGLIIFPIIGGLLAGIVVKRIYLNNKNNKPINTILLLIIFFSCIFVWMSSGGITSLFHISVFFHISMLYILLKLVLFIINIKIRN